MSESFKDQIEAHCEIAHEDFEDKIIRRVDKKITNCKEDLNDKVDNLDTKVTHLTAEFATIKAKLEEKLERDDTRIEQIVDAWNNARGALWFTKVLIYIIGAIASAYIFIKSNFLIQLK